MSLGKNYTNISNFISNNITSPILEISSNHDSYNNLSIDNQSSSDEYNNNSIELISIIGIICNVFQPLIYLAPIKCFYKMIIKNETKKIPIYYFLFNIIQNLIWIVVSTKKIDIAILTANTISAAFFVIFLIGFIIISTGKNLGSIMLKINLAILLIISTVYLGFNNLNFSLTASIAVIMETTCYLSILQFIKEVFEYEDPSYIDLPIVASIFIVNFWWVVYSSIKYNLVLFIPNFIGFIVSTAVLYINYYYSVKRNSKEVLKLM
jgi:solute carrier family 50 protein (sugar transporter)